MPLEVIGPGFGRTGTNSLKIALEQLGLRALPPHVRGPRQSRAPCRLGEIGARREGRLGPRFPGATALRWIGRAHDTGANLSDTIQRRKWFLSVRDPDEWFDSVQATIVPFLAARGHHSSPHVNAICEMGHEIVAAQVFNGCISERQHATQVFKNHIADVQSDIPADRLLTFDLRDGWQPLCEFLRVEVPDNPFPKTNSSKEFVEQEWKQA